MVQELICWCAQHTRHIFKDKVFCRIKTLFNVKISLTSEKVQTYN